MIFETYAPGAPFEQFITSIFHLKGFAPDHSIERVIPTGHIFMIFELDGIERNTFDNDTLVPIAQFNKVWVSGMHKNYISISAHQDSELFVIQFSPFGCFPFLGIPASELNDNVFPGEELLDGELLLLRNRLLQAEGSQAKFQIAGDWLEKRFDESRIPPKEMIQLVENMQQQPTLNFQRATSEYPHTGKHMIAQFKRFVGLNPKGFHRILRFNEILKQIQNKEMIQWSQVAYSCGYSDQSHFIKEFKLFSGFNPQEFIQLEFNKEPPNFFPLDREG